MYSSLFIQGVDLFALKIYLDRVVPINHSWHQKTRDTGLPGSEDRISLRSLILTQYGHVTDRRTDRQTDGRTNLHIQRLQSYALRIVVKSPKQCIHENGETASLNSVIETSSTSTENSKMIVRNVKLYFQLNEGVADDESGDSERNEGEEN